MMFFLSKALLFLLFPVTWLFGIFLWAIITKRVRRRKRLLVAGVIVLYLSSCPLLLATYAGLWHVEGVNMTKHPAYSCGILLGGFSGVNSDQSGYFNIHSDRFIQALKLQEAHQIKHLLVSGGNGGLFAGSFSEAVWTREQLLQLNVPDSSISIEGRSKNTIQNALFSRRLLDSLHLPPPYLLITSDFHMRRALYIFRKAGVNVQPYPTGFLTGPDDFHLDSLLPSDATLFYWEFYTKELIGLVVAHLSKF